MSDEKASNQLTLFAAGSPVKMSALLDAVRDWMESDRDFGSSSYELLQSLNRNGLLSKTSLACYPPMNGETLPRSFQGWGNAGIGGPTGFLTLSFLEFPKDAAVCSLSDVLETGPVPQKYYLSPRAARGILRRAEKRGKELPPVLQQALRQVAESTPRDEGERMTQTSFRPEPLPETFEEWYEATKDYGGTREEWERLMKA